MQHFDFLIAGAGLADQVDDIALVVAWLGLITAAGAATSACFRSSRVLAIVALALLAVLSVLFMPWEAFRKPEPMYLVDPDYVASMNSWRAFAVGWTVALPVLIPLAVMGWFRHSKRAI